jgi:glycosyltransferase involved in cell wall biosynthesis
MPAPLRVLTFSTLYPNSVMPGNGIFVETRLRHVLERAPHVRAHVVAPVPWFPFAGKRFGRYGRFAAVPRRETWHGITVEHPRHVVVPKATWRTTPFTLAAQSYPTIRRLLIAENGFDVIDAHYLFPDGVAAALLSKAARKPFVMTARGSDVRELAKYRLPRALIRWAASQAFKVITVSAALARDLEAIGVPPERLVVLRNGVDLSLFSPGNRAVLRDGLRLSSGPVLASVGRLVELKGHDLVIRALTLLPDATLVVAGEGPERKRLEGLSRSIGVDARVRFLGELSQQELVAVYGGADALVLASRHEGWPNVLLEAMACGCPVIAAELAGIREIVRSDDAGVIMQERSPEGIAQAARRLLARHPGAETTRRYAEDFGWDATSDGQVELFTAAAYAGRMSTRAARMRPAA